ncbi:hypothetical protein [Rossellomorea vietnamensis]|uniref:hypothetical protein n=1 Tax=Rossellomorea vietnamensis TaxID=218284 RepID=UPI0012DBED43|nr:hypothetical protein [Rossellomorea vietnamensis]
MSFKIYRIIHLVLTGIITITISLFIASSVPGDRTQSSDMFTPVRKDLLEG